jgi:hypothetical protein
MSPLPSLSWCTGRWLEFYVSAPQALVHYALTSGTRELFTLLLIGFGTSVIMIFGYMFECDEIMDPRERLANQLSQAGVSRGVPHVYGGEVQR